VRDDLPSGTVTFLFTDVEGSTKLLHELGADGYAEALAEHRRIVRSACTAEGGVEVDTQGDAFFFAFVSAPGALEAAASLTEALASGAIQVRVGLHTGSPLLTEEGYVGDDVHFAARVAASGHGGQVVLSRATARLAEGEFVDLGEHRLKDIPEPVPLYQLGEGRFPPLKTISNTNLPRPASSFVGRGREVGDVLARLRSGVRLLTLTGPGGSGKTRLAIEAAGEMVAEFNAGVYWVGLAPVRDSALVADTIGRTIGAHGALLAEHIGHRELLLVLDNLEQVVDAAPDLASLVEACPNLRLLVTSRALLRVRGEVEYAIEPLEDAEAIALFCERAGIGADRAVEELCRALDNLPLAVELAAARTSVLSPRQITERLAERLDLFTGGRDADPRQRTLRATIAWSHDLLGAEEQRLFSQLAIFARGCTYAAAENVAGAGLDALQSLVEKGLVRHTDERFWMLETIREYAAERLRDSGEAAETGRRHAEHYRSFAVDTAVELGGPRPGEAYERVDRDLDNLRSAVRWGVEERRFDIALAIVVSLERYWSARGCPKDVLDFVDEAAERVADSVDDELRAQALWVGGFAAGRAGDGFDAGRAGELERAERLLAQSVDLFRKLDRGYEVVRSLSELAIIKEERGCEAEATELAEEALATAHVLGEPRAADAAATAMGTIAYWRGDFAQAAEHYEESLRLCRQGDSLPGPIASRLVNIGLCARVLEDYDRAETVLREALAVATGSGHAVLIGISATSLGYVMLARRDLTSARSFLRQALDVVHGMEIAGWTASALNLAAAIAAAGGDDRTAAQLWGTVDAWLENNPYRPEADEQHVRQRFEQRARLALEPSQFVTATEDGRQMTAQQALQLATRAADATTSGDSLQRAG
jgi:predicted ATPase